MIRLLTRIIMSVWQRITRRRVLLMKQTREHQMMVNLAEAVGTNNRKRVEESARQLRRIFDKETQVVTGKHRG